MITIPLAGFTPQEGEELKTILLALFVDVVDNRLISIMTEKEVTDYTELLMQDSVCEELYEMVSIFGEEDFVTFIKPVVTKLASTNYNREDYLQTFKIAVGELK